MDQQCWVCDMMIPGHTGQWGCHHTFLLASSLECLPPSLPSAAEWANWKAPAPAHSPLCRPLNAEGDYCFVSNPAWCSLHPGLLIYKGFCLLYQNHFKTFWTNWYWRISNWSLFLKIWIYFFHFPSNIWISILVAPCNTRRSTPYIGIATQIIWEMHLERWWQQVSLQM